MIPTATVSNVPPQLPNELCHEIIKNLHPVNDRSTFPRLALVSNAWCAESQPVLFRTVYIDSPDPDKRESLIDTHTLFLQSIISDPIRLGSYVQTYKQSGLICHPSSKIPSSAAASYLWDLTTKALPALVNLKQLVIISSYDNPVNPRPAFLEHCTFDLQTFRWGFEVMPPNGTQPMVKFLRTQRNLLHLEIGLLPQKQDLSWLPDDVCPNLISVSCRLGCADQVTAERTSIVGLMTTPHRLGRVHLSGLHRLQYLSTLAPSMVSNWGTEGSSLILLEITSWSVDRAVQSLSGLSKLRVLSLLRAPRHTPPPTTFDNNSDADTMREHRDQMRLIIESFKRCPSLEYVVIEDIYSGQGPRRYRKLSLTAHEGTPRKKQEIQSEEFFVEYELGMPWWTAYGM